jgi:ribosomal protein S18 acetylase RimI-like enzyme
VTFVTDFLFITIISLVREKTPRYTCRCAFGAEGAIDMDIKITAYEPWMAGTLAKMWDASKNDWGGGNDTKTPGQVATRIEGSSIMNHYVALAGEEAVGYASLGRYFGDADALYIELLGVRPDYQGKKVGKALVLECVKRTIELGYPRLDIHTWPGNTAAIPLYKKCGYLWEDRADSTHLVNFIPEILGTALFKPFFAKADWYTDSTRSWAVERDGVKVNKFEVFGYTWEKDGETLAVGYERTGRRIRLIETNDYKIEMMADNHELAFGLTYGCKFTVTNKSGKDLYVKINGKPDKNIRFDFTAEEKITDTREFAADFYVGEISEVQDTWKVHPCVLAEVEINGQAVTFGLGINAKYPLAVGFTSEYKVMQIGAMMDCFINIKSALLQDAEVTFTLTDETLSDTWVNGIKQSTFTVKVDAEGKTSIPVSVKQHAAGYSPALTVFHITLADGTQLSFTKPLHYMAQDLTHGFFGEWDSHYYIVNGPWRVILNKSDSEAAISHITNPMFDKGWFNPPKFGKPFDDEFNLIKPRVTSFARGTDMVMEAEYLSEKFSGMALVMVFTLNAAGIVTRYYRVENRGNITREMFLNDSYWLALGRYTTFKYRGAVTQNHDGLYPDGSVYGIDSVDSGDLEENWIFEAEPGGARGFCWPPSMKPALQWGNMATFETDLGRMSPGDVFETPPVVMVYGLFTHFTDFRNYAMQLADKGHYIPAGHVELMLNGHNPFLPVQEDNSENNPLQEIKLAVLNHRETTLAGEINVSSDWFETQVFTNGLDSDTASDNDNDDGNDDDETETEADKELCFTLPLDQNPYTHDNITAVCVEMKLSSYEKAYNRVLFAPQGNIVQSVEGSVYTVNNGKITFRADAAYGPVCYSMTTPDGTEWLKHQYPEHKPFAWWSPFLGGIRAIPSHMNNESLLKEETSADFAKVTDNFGNVWQGICTTVHFTQDDDLKGAVLETYYVTLPGLPMVCSFYRFVNGTGVYQSFSPEFDAFLLPADDGAEFYAEFVNKNGEAFRLRYGRNGDMEEDFANTIKFTSPRPQRVYGFHGNKNNNKTNNNGGDTKFQSALDIRMECHAKPGEVFTSSPLFILLTEKDLPIGALDSLERIVIQP